MMRFALLLTYLGLSTATTKTAVKFPICKQSDKNVENCLQAIIQDAITRMKEGIPELGASSIDPLLIPKLKFESKGTGIVNVEQTLKNIKISNLSRLRINKFRYTKKDNFILDLELHAPEIIFEADYEISGRILLLPINGSGYSKTLQENYQVTAHAEFNIDDSKTHFRIEEFRIELNVEKIIYKFENLFNGNAELGEEMNGVLNKNWKDVFNDVKEEHEELLSQILTAYTNKIFRKTEAQYLFPE